MNTDRGLRLGAAVAAAVFLGHAGAAWAGEDPLAKDAFYNLGLMYDARRKLVWTTTALNRASALKADPKTAVLQKLE